MRHVCLFRRLSGEKSDTKTASQPITIREHRRQLAQTLQDARHLGRPWLAAGTPTLTQLITMRARDHRLLTTVALTPSIGGLDTHKTHTHHNHPWTPQHPNQTARPQPGDGTTWRACTTGRVSNPGTTPIRGTRWQRVATRRMENAHDRSAGRAEF